MIYASANNTQTHTPALILPGLTLSARYPTLRGLLGVREVADSVHVGQ